MKKALMFFCAVALLSAGCGRNDGTEVITVASERADCVGVAPMRCLLVMYEGDDEWQLWYSGIEGFDYEPGYEYRLEIRKETVADPPADASSIRYLLVKELSKKQKQSENLPMHLINEEYEF